jgi:hypothetical protein
MCLVARLFCLLLSPKKRHEQQIPEAVQYSTWYISKSDRRFCPAQCMQAATPAPSNPLRLATEVPRMLPIRPADLISGAKGGFPENECVLEELTKAASEPEQVPTVLNGVTHHSNALLCLLRKPPSEVRVACCIGAQAQVDRRRKKKC